MPTEHGEGWSVAHHLGELGEGPGFRKVRHELDVEAFGVNAIVLPPSWKTQYHFHDEQDELYVVLSGRVAIRFGDGTEHELEPGGMAHVSAATHRQLRNLLDDAESTYLCVGGKGGYVGRDGNPVDDAA